MTGRRQLRDRAHNGRKTQPRRLVERAVEASGSNLTDFAESSLVLAAQRVMADREQFVLPERAAAEWDAINSLPARELPGLRKLMARSSPFDE